MEGNRSNEAFGKKMPMELAMAWEMYRSLLSTAESAPRCTVVDDDAVDITEKVLGKKQATMERELDFIAENAPFAIEVAKRRWGPRWIVSLAAFATAFLNDKR